MQPAKSFTLTIRTTGITFLIILDNFVSVIKNKGIYNIQLRNQLTA